MMHTDENVESYTSLQGDVADSLEREHILKYMSLQGGNSPSLDILITCSGTCLLTGRRWYCLFFNAL
jgi:hypothetical protein